MSILEDNYSPKFIERKLQADWDKHPRHAAQEDLNKEKFFALAMFPYPSGELHMGHVRNYTICDVIARYQRMLGKNVLQPIGWDSFGLPAENAAIKHKTAPSKWTYHNIEQMRTQLKRLGFAYDWSREITTCHPNYYRWEQWFFLKLFSKGLIYKKNARVNWDPVDQTVLANEQVINGCGWRSGAPVECKIISQWFIRITAYAEQLLADLAKLNAWPERVKSMQRNWIGRSEGVIIRFKLTDTTYYNIHSLSVFSTRPDTLYGVSFVCIAVDHPLATQIAEENTEVKAFIHTCTQNKKTEAEFSKIKKEGIFTGVTVQHPLSEHMIPVWVGNYVLMDYGTGAVMAVPAHDQRDWEFAEKYQLPKPQAIRSEYTAHDITQSPYCDDGILMNSGEFSDLSSQVAREKIINFLEKNQLGEKQITYRLRDWGISRQRYWGTPIPIIYCDLCGTVPVPEADLPVTLPEYAKIPETGSVLKQDPNFYRTICPKCQKPATRETDTLDTFVESSWYYARYASATQDKAMLDERANYWTPVDFYVGGIEHAVMHLLYARFFHKLMRDLKLLNSDEPFIELLTQGMVLKDGSKMSKSKANIVDPKALIEKYGADTVRLFTIFSAPPEQSLEWSDDSVAGAHRFLKRLWSTFSKHARLFSQINTAKGTHHIEWDSLRDDLKAVRKESQSILKQVLYDYERKQLNTIVSGAMKLFNLIQALPVSDSIDPAAMLAYKISEDVLKILSPITPHITAHLWQALSFEGTLSVAAWPKVAKDIFKLQSVSYVVQINGKRKTNISASSELNGDKLIQLASMSPNITKIIGERKIVKSIIVNHRRLINLVVR